MQNNAPTTPKDALRAVNIVFYALIGGLLIFTAIVFSADQFLEPRLNDDNLARILLIVVLFVAAISISTAARLYKKRIEATHVDGLRLMDKLDIYRSVMITYLALCEGPGLFALISFFLTSNKLFLVITAFAVLAMLLKRPQKSKIFNELQLNTAEQMELN